MDVGAFWHVASQAASFRNRRLAVCGTFSLALQGRNILHNNAAYANSLRKKSYENLRKIWIRNYLRPIFRHALPRTTTERQRGRAKASYRQDRSLSRERGREQGH